jgi:hypothetical protein
VSCAYHLTFACSAEKKAKREAEEAEIRRRREESELKYVCVCVCVCVHMFMRLSLQFYAYHHSSTHPPRSYDRLFKEEKMSSNKREGNVDMRKVEEEFM